MLKEKRIPNPELDLRILLRHAAKTNKDIILSNFESKDIDIDYFNSLILKRLNNEPISKIIKKKFFWKHEFFVNSNVLDPRPDTELIIEEVLNNVKNRNKKLKILDIGTGSGCILLSILKEKKDFYGTGIDISKKSLEISKINALKLGISNRVKFFKSDIDNFLSGKYDLIISNPPYIKSIDLKYLERDVIKFEPKIALNGGIDGVSEIRKVINKSSELIKVNGKLVLEIAFNQKAKVKELLNKKGFYVNKIFKDYANNNRCIICTKL